MKNHIIVITLALSGAASHAFAQAKPTSTIEVGPSVVDDGSYKAGEYNGLQKQGGYGIGNIDWRGGSAGYNTTDTLRWRVRATDLGLDTRTVFAEIGQQGRFRFFGGFDQLRRNRSDTFQTPFLGTGTNVLTLPSGWIVPTVAGSSGSSTAVNAISARGLVPTIGAAPYINTATNSSTMGAVLTPSLAQIALVNAAAGTDVPFFQNYNLFTKRTKVDVGFAYNFDTAWAIDASFRPEHKDGVKPMGTVSRNTGGDISTVIPDVIDNDHDQLNVSLNYKGAKSFATAGYYGSRYRNNVPFMSWQNWATTTGTTNTISSTPGNDFNQFTLTAGVNFSPVSKLVATGSYGHSAQNASFITDATTPVVPVSSLNGLVVNTAFSAKYTARPVKKLALVAGYKYDDRDNRTAVHIFQYADAGEAAVANAAFPAGPNNPLGAVVAQNANANRPYSRRLNQATFDADYGFVKGQWIKAGYDFEKIDRGCPASWISCADADTTNEGTARAEWRASLGSELSARVGYAYSSRRAPNYNENAFLALVPYAGVAPASATAGATALAFMLQNGWTGYGPTAGFAATTGNMNLFFPSNNALANTMYANNNRISELPGMRRYYVADRNRNKVRTALTWQANDALSFQGGLDLNKDQFPTSTYGVQNVDTWAVNVDGSYTFAEVWSANVFYTLENLRSLTAGNSYTANSSASAITNGQTGVVGLSGNSCDGFATLLQRNNNNKIDPCLNWSSDMVDKVHSLGFGLKGAFGNLDITGNLTLSRARWDNTVIGGNWNNNILDGPGAAPTTVAAFFIPASPVPTVTTNSGEVRLIGTYKIDRLQSLRIGYSYLRMTSDDPAFEGMQFGSVSTLLPTNEQAFVYSVNVVGVSYILTF